MNDEPGTAAYPPAPDGTGAGIRETLSAVEAEFVRDLFVQHRLALYRYLERLLFSREDAQEILQETYLRLARQSSFERLRLNARAYLFQTATNLANDLFRQRARKTPWVEAEMFEASGLASPHWASWPELALQGEQTQALIIKALQDLSPAPRTALLQHRFQKLTHREIAVRLGVSERTVERYIKDGLALIASRLEAAR